MIRAQFTLRLVCLVTLLFLTVSSRDADATNTFSGRIVDVKGHPVSGLTLITRPTKLINGHAINAVGDVPKSSSEFKKSDDAGFFIITNVQPGPVQLELRSPMPGESRKSYEILSMKIGLTTFYPTAPSHRKGVKFAIEPDADLVDAVVVTVRPRTRYRGQVVLKDGTPLAYTTVNLGEQSKYKQGNNPVSMKVAYPTHTDANGYFIRYVDEPEFEVALFTVEVKCQGLSETAEFALNSGEQKENLVFTLQGTRMSMRGRIVFDDGTPLPEAWFTLDVQGDTLDNESRFRFSSLPMTDDDGYFITNLYQPGAFIASVDYQGLSATSELALNAGEQQGDVVFTLNGAPVFFDMSGVEMMAPTVPNTIGVWIGAPNGSQYKSVRCSDWRDALTKARTEDAELVSINDKAEQEWLVEQFGFLPYWIGLAYSIETGEWEWSSGEPLTYTNWAMGQPKPIGGENYGSMDGSGSGHWRVGVLGDTPKAAILEKK